MAHLLLNLRNVPDDEADEVRALLDAAHIAYYETRPSRWGISAGAIWIADEADAFAAQQAMAAYQLHRRERARAERDQAEIDGTAPTLWSNVRAEPVRAIVVLLTAALVGALVVLPVFLLSR